MVVPIVTWAAYTVAKTTLMWAVADLSPGLGISLKSSDKRFTLVRALTTRQGAVDLVNISCGVSKTFQATMMNLRATSKAHRFHAKLKRQHSALLWITLFSMSEDLLALITY